MNVKIPKIILGQVDSSISKHMGPHFPNDKFAIEVADRGDRLLTMMEKDPPDLVLLGMTLQDPDAIQICRTIKANPKISSVIVIIVAPSNDPSLQKAALEAGCNDLLLEPINSTVLLARINSLLRLKYLSDELNSAGDVLNTLARAIEVKDRYTMGHADRVSSYAIELGRKMGVTIEEITTLQVGGMLHDIGKIAIPDQILTKPGKYTPDEFEVMKRHPVLGCEICEKLKTVKDALPIIRHHHEKLDGTGYPDGLKGDKIPPMVRIVTIVDIYDALRSKRSYKDAFTIDKTFEIMWQEVDKGWWDKNILTVWEKNIRSKQSDTI